MKSYEIKVGDTVWLKSGGPPMTVVYNDYHTIHVAWASYGGPGVLRDSLPADCFTTEDPADSQKKAAETTKPSPESPII